MTSRAAHYLGEIRGRGTAEVLGEMGLLGLRMQSVTATIRERGISRIHVRECFLLHPGGKIQQLRLGASNGDGSL